jgi:tripartite-type tricarboxylate transporter receptor subunit TctC
MCGLPDIQLNGWAALFVKQGTPARAKTALRKAFSSDFESPEYRQYISETGGFHEPLNQEQLTTYIRNEIARAQDTFRRAGIQPE